MKYINTVISITVIFLVVLTVINGEVLRPKLKHLHHLSIILNSLPNFAGSFILYMLILGGMGNQTLNRYKAIRTKVLMVCLGLLVIAFLSIEEYVPFFTANKTFDINDILANIVGVFCAYILFNFLIYKYLKNKVENC